VLTSFRQAICVGDDDDDDKNKNTTTNNNNNSVQKILVIVLVKNDITFVKPKGLSARTLSRLISSLDVFIFHLDRQVVSCIELSTLSGLGALYEPVILMLPASVLCTAVSAFKGTINSRAPPSGNLVAGLA
jgi:hypothetical protein